MSLSLFAALAFSSTSAQAAPDLTTSITVPSVVVGAVGAYAFTVTNLDSNSGNVTLTVGLPRTNTSPTVHVLGDLGALPTGCTRSSTTVTCTMTGIKRNKSKTTYLTLAVPWSADDITFTATASTSGETNTGNNSSSAVADVTYYANSIADGSLATIEHCTGTDLLSFFECELYPSSISSHEHIFEAGGIISIPGYPDYSGAWSHPGGDTSQLVFNYTELGTEVLTFAGDGVEGGCYDGMATFPGSTYNSPYHICF